MKLAAIIGAVWFALSIVFGTVWALCGMAYDRRLRDAQVIIEAQRILDAESLRVWGP